MHAVTQGTHSDASDLVALLLQDVPIPLFFQEKKEEEWTDEEKRAAAEYQKKVKELEEEREKFRKVDAFIDSTTVSLNEMIHLV